MRSGIAAGGVLTAIDVLKVVARRGTPTLDELDQSFTESSDYLPALDLAVENGYLQVLPDGPVTHDQYRLSSRGRRMLGASASGNLAA